MKTLIMMLIGMLLFVSSCQNSGDNAHTSSLITGDSESETIRLTQLLEDTFSHQWHENDQNWVFFLILRDCSCVDENIDFIQTNLPTLKSKAHFIIKNPENTQRWRNLKAKLESENASFKIDSANLFETRGFIYATDKVFQVKSDKVVAIDDFKIENHSIFINQINQK